MNQYSPHSFHIPVMGLGFTIDTPLKVARFGISSVVSIIEDHLIERMRGFHCHQTSEEYIPISSKENDHRAKRITAYLNLIERIINKQMLKLKAETFEAGNEIVKYFEMLPEESPVKHLYSEMKNADGEEKYILQNKLRENIFSGSIDVNIMTKCDRNNYSKDGALLPPEYADAMAALRGFAQSNLSSSVVFSAGMNPRLYGYCESFIDFFPDKNGNQKKKIIVKVSDYRSALIQGKIFAKKGLWISEFRIESGLNCGGHAFATAGILMGPILEEFKNRRAELLEELYNLSNAALKAKGNNIFTKIPEMKITFQGGIGTVEENKFLIQHYNLTGTGWGSPFLLVPEATNVDAETLQQLSVATRDEYYLNDASPLGVLINNFKNSSGDKQRKLRIEKGRPGGPCNKKFLAFNTEFTEVPICSGSREYQSLKLAELKNKNLPPEIFDKEEKQITAKECLCEGLGASVLLKNNLNPAHNLKAVSICPGPNLAYFSGTFTLQQMVNHVYGRMNLLNDVTRPHVFINELKMYVEYLKKEIEKNMPSVSPKQKKYLDEFRNNLISGISYYKSLVQEMKIEGELRLNDMRNQLSAFQNEVMGFVFNEEVAAG